MARPKSALGEKEQQERVNRANAQPHRRNVAGEEALDPRLESPLGRMYFYGLIFEPQYEAGRRYADIVLEFRHSIGAPLASPTALDFDSALSTGPMVWPSDRRCEEIKKAYNQAFNALFDCGQKITKAVNQVAVQELEPIFPDLVKLGLSALADHFEQSARKVIPFSRFTAI